MARRGALRIKATECDLGAVRRADAQLSGILQVIFYRQGKRVHVIGWDESAESAALDYVRWSGDAVRCDHGDAEGQGLCQNERVALPSAREHEQLGLS